MTPNTSNPPFQIGQRVVCVSDGKAKGTNLRVDKGVVYTVHGIRQCGCGIWSVNVGIRHGSTNVVYSICNCQKRNLSFGYVWAKASLFAPIQETYTDATEEILEKFKQTEERPDKVLIPETVNN